MISSLHRPTLAKVDLSAISENIAQVVSYIPKQVKTFAVVKANAYGHGAVEVAKHVSKQVDGFCVSNLDEALELRQAGIEQPILILGVVLPDGIPLAIQENISLTVASLEWLALAQKQELDLTGLTCHIKVDSGIWHAATVFNTVRLGVVIYGLNPSGSVLELPYNIQPALSLETALIHVKTLPAGQDVGYGATYTTTDEEVIGTLPIGYADGWTRDLQGFHVIVDGQLCPIVGRVSMDQITVRLPKVYPLGTPVTLMGENGGASITATEVAEKRGTINYEVLCLLSDRVPRSYD